MSLLVVLKLHLGEQLGVDFAGHAHLLARRFLQTLSCRHFDQILAARLIGLLPQKLIRRRPELTRSRVRWRHQVRIANLLQAGDYIGLAVEFFMDELVELVDGNVFEISILTLGHEPIEHFLEGVLLALLVGEVEGVAALLVEGSQSVC